MQMESPEDSDCSEREAEALQERMRKAAEALRATGVVFHAPLTESEVSAFEARHEVELPEAFRWFLLHIGNGFSVGAGGTVAGLAPIDSEEYGENLKLPFGGEDFSESGQLEFGEDDEENGITWEMRGEECSQRIQEAEEEAKEAMRTGG